MSDRRHSRYNVSTSARQVYAEYQSSSGHNGGTNPPLVTMGGLTFSGPTHAAEYKRPPVCKGSTPVTGTIVTPRTVSLVLQAGKWNLAARYRAPIPPGSISSQYGMHVRCVLPALLSHCNDGYPVEILVRFESVRGRTPVCVGALLYAVLWWCSVLLLYSYIAYMVILPIWLYYNIAYMAVLLYCYIAIWSSCHIAVLPYNHIVVQYHQLVLTMVESAHRRLVGNFSWVYPYHSFITQHYRCHERLQRPANTGGLVTKQHCPTIVIWLILPVIYACLKD